MNKLFASVFIVAALGASAVVAPAMPFSSDRIQGNLTDTIIASSEPIFGILNVYKVMLG